MFLGTLLRWMFISDTGLNFRHVLHSHSHLALLGWVYQALILLIIDTYIKKERQTRYRGIFIFNLSVVWAMTPAFIYNGYWWLSIAQSGLQMIGSYVFIRMFLKDAKNENTKGIGFIKSSLFFLFLSTLGPWSMGPVMATGGSGSDLYYSLVYFFLHFQYNGFFFFALAGLALYYWPGHLNLLAVKRSRLILFYSTLLSFLMSILFSQPPIWVFVLSIFSGAGLISGFILYLKSFTGKVIVNSTKRFIILVLISFTFIKLFLQFSGSFPAPALWVATSRNLVIAYLHFVLIGIISSGVIIGFYYQNLIRLNRISIAGFLLILSGLLIQEIILILPYAGFISTLNFQSIILVVAASMMFLGGLVAMTSIKDHRL